MFKIHKLIHFSRDLLRFSLVLFPHKSFPVPLFPPFSLVLFTLYVGEELSLNYEIFHRPPAEPIENVSWIPRRERGGINYADNDWPTEAAGLCCSSELVQL